MAADIFQVQRAESPEQACQRERHEQVNPGVARDVELQVIADEQGAERGRQHQGHPGIASGTVQMSALHAAFAGPEGNGADGQCGQRGSHVDGDNGGELHGGAFVVWWHDCAGSTSPCTPVCDGTQSGRSEMQPRGVNGSRKKGVLPACHVRATGAF